MAKGWLSEAHVSDEEIADLLGEFYKRIGTTAREALNQISADEEVAGDTVTESQFESKLKAAGAYLDQVYALKDAIAKLQSDPTMKDTSILDALVKVFGTEEVDRWMQEATVDGKLVVSMFLEKLKAEMKKMTTDDESLDTLRFLGLDATQIVAGINSVYDVAEQTIKDRIAKMKAGSVWGNTEELWNGLFGGTMEAFGSAQSIREGWGGAMRLQGLWKAASGPVTSRTESARQELADALGVTMDYLKANMTEEGAIAKLVDAQVSQAVESMTLFKDMLLELGVVTVGENPNV